jgi:hypothetical protein
MATEVISSKEELEQWRKRIESAWQKSVESVVEVGKLVKQAKELLGVSYSLLETELPFSSTVATFLIKIAENPVLTNPNYFSKLPNGYNTLYYLSSVEPKELVKQIESGEITPNFTLAKAKTMRDESPKSKKASLDIKSKIKNPIFEVGVISISAPSNFNQFSKDLEILLEKYKGTVNYTHKDTSIAEFYNQQLLAEALEKIKKGEAELKNISFEELRMLEEASFYMSKDKNKKKDIEIVFNNELVKRKGLPDDYKDKNKIAKLINKEEITAGHIAEWCKENKVPNQFLDMKSMDKEFYLWEQVRLILEKKDVKGGMKRLKDMGSHGRVPEIKALSLKLLEELTRFDNRSA